MAPLSICFCHCPFPPLIRTVKWCGGVGPLKLLHALTCSSTCLIRPLLWTLLVTIGGNTVASVLTSSIKPAKLNLPYWSSRVIENVSLGNISWRHAVNGQRWVKIWQARTCCSMRALWTLRMQCPQLLYRWCFNKSPDHIRKRDRWESDGIHFFLFLIFLYFVIWVVPPWLLWQPNWFVVLQHILPGSVFSSTHGNTNHILYWACNSKWNVKCFSSCYCSCEMSLRVFICFLQIFANSLSWMSVFIILSKDAFFFLYQILISNGTQWNDQVISHFCTQNLTAGTGVF